MNDLIEFTDSRGSHIVIPARSIVGFEVGGRVGQTVLCGKVLVEGGRWYGVSTEEGCRVLAAWRASRELAHGAPHIATIADNYGLEGTR